jgi:futalosine hydrolase
MSVPVRVGALAEYFEVLCIAPFGPEEFVGRGECFFSCDVDHKFRARKDKNYVMAESYLCPDIVVMKILIVSATEMEVNAMKRSWRKKHHIDFLTTGAGMTATAYHLAKRFSVKKYDLAINIGLAGSFRKEIKLGEVVNVVSDCFADLGAEDGNKFLSSFEIGLQKKNQFPFGNGILTPVRTNSSALKHFRKVKGITVNTVHGEVKSIANVKRKFNPDIETMEGAAFFYACMMEKVPCIQLRSISNYVVRRNKAKWNIELALEELHQQVNKFISDCTHEL